MGGWRGIFTLVRRIRREISGWFAGRELAFNIRQVFQLAGGERQLLLQNVMLLTQGIQFAVAGLLEFAVTLALFCQLQLQRGRRARADTTGEPAPGSQYLTRQCA